MYVCMHLYVLVSTCLFCVYVCGCFRWQCFHILYTFKYSLKFGTAVAYTYSCVCVGVWTTYHYGIVLSYILFTFSLFSFHLLIYISTFFLIFVLASFCFDFNFTITYLDVYESLASDWGCKFLAINCMLLRNFAPMPPAFYFQP